MGVCADPGLKTKSLIAQTWKKESKKKTTLYITDLEIKAGFVIQDKHTSMVYVTLNKETPLKIFSGKNKNEAMIQLHDYIGLK